MKLHIFSRIWAILYLIIGLGLLILPAEFMSSYGVKPDENGQLMSRILGAALTAFALTFYLNRNLPVSETGWKNLLICSFVYNLIDYPIVVSATLNGVMNSMGWMPVGLHIFLAGSMAYFAFRK